MNIDKKQLKILSLEFRTIANRLINCHWQTGLDLLTKFISYIDDNEIIRDYVQSYVNPDDFKDYTYRPNMIFCSMGETKQKEISFTYQFLKYIVNNCQSNFYRDFAHGYAQGANDSVKEFCNRIILPFVNYIEGYLTEIGIQMGYDENTQFTINVSGGNPQLNIVNGKGELTATQSIGIDTKQLECIIEEIRNTISTESFGSEDLEVISDSLEAIKAELRSLKPKKGMLRTALNGLKMINGSTQFVAAVTTLIQFVNSSIQ